VSYRVVLVTHWSVSFCKHSAKSMPGIDQILGGSGNDEIAPDASCELRLVLALFSGSEM
jgi:hypothetical protein